MRRTRFMWIPMWRRWTHVVLMRERSLVDGAVIDRTWDVPTASRLEAFMLLWKRRASLQCRLLEARVLSREELVHEILQFVDSELTSLRVVADRPSIAAREIATALKLEFYVVVRLLEDNAPDLIKFGKVIL